MSDKYVRLKDNADNIYPEMYGIDTSNLIASGLVFTESSNAYTFEQDCYVVLILTWGQVNKYMLNGVPILGYGDGSGAKDTSNYFFAKKGDVFSCTNPFSTIATFSIYGIKYHS